MEMDIFSICLLPLSPSCKSKEVSSLATAAGGNWLYFSSP
jgi:hypothetical protein